MNIPLIVVLLEGFKRQRMHSVLSNFIFVLTLIFLSACETATDVGVREYVLKIKNESGIPIDRIEVLNKNDPEQQVLNIDKSEFSETILGQDSLTGLNIVLIEARFDVEAIGGSNVELLYTCFSIGIPVLTKEVSFDITDSISHSIGEPDSLVLNILKEYAKITLNNEVDHRTVIDSLFAVAIINEQSHSDKLYIVYKQIDEGDTNALIAKMYDVLTQQSHENSLAIISDKILPYASNDDLVSLIDAGPSVGVSSSDVLVAQLSNSQDVSYSSSSSITGAHVVSASSTTTLPVSQLSSSRVIPDLTSSTSSENNNVSSIGVSSSSFSSSSVISSSSVVSSSFVISSSTVISSSSVVSSSSLTSSSSVISSSSVASSSSVISSSSQVSSSSFIESLIAHWKFEDNTVCEVPGISDGVEHGTIAYVDGVDGKAISFDYVDAAVSFPDNISDFELPHITLMGWFKVNSFVNYKGIWQNQSNGSGLGLVFHPDGKVYISYHDQSNWRFTGTSAGLNIDEWYHISGTFDGAKLKLYINGSLVSEKNSSTPIVYNGITPYMGDDFANNFSDHRAFDGYVDDFKIYNYAVSPTVVEDHYLDLVSGIPESSSSFSSSSEISSSSVVSSSSVISSSSQISSSSFTGSLIAHWKFEDNTVCEIPGISDGVEHGTIAYVDGVDGRAISFDYIDAAVSFPDNVSDFELPHITLMGWFKANSFVNYKGIWQNQSNGSGLGLVFHPDGKAYISYRDQTNWRFTGTSAGLNSDEWYHITGTFDGVTLKLYINGSLVSEKSSSTPIVYNGTTSYFGDDFANNFSDHKAFDGYVDDFKIYDEALPGKMILDDFDQFAP